MRLLTAYKPSCFSITAQWTKILQDSICRVTKNSIVVGLYIVS